MQLRFHSLHLAGQVASWPGVWAGMVKKSCRTVSQKLQGVLS